MKTTYFLIKIKIFSNILIWILFEKYTIEKKLDNCLLKTIETSCFRQYRLCVFKVIHSNFIVAASPSLANKKNVLS